MKNCEQTKGQSVLDHGISVKNWTFDLINRLRNGDILKNEWILPDWVYENRDLILENLPSDKTLKYYTILHDCGKPYCLETDDLGKRHFPNHSEVSYRIFKNLFVDEVSDRLIKGKKIIQKIKQNNENKRLY